MTSTDARGISIVKGARRLLAKGSLSLAEAATRAGYYTTRRTCAVTSPPWPAALPQSWRRARLRCAHRPVTLPTRDIRPRQPRRCQ